MTINQKTLLLVEDEAIISMEQARMLEKEGYTVVQAFSGAEAVAIVNKKGATIDLILMDIDLGRGMDGTEAAREVLKDHDIPVVFLSSHTEKEIVEKTETITSYGYVVKNTGIIVLKASINMAFKLFEAHCGLRAKTMEIEEINEELNTTIEEMEAASEDLMQSQKVIMESEERYHVLFDNMLNGFALLEIIFDQTGSPADFRFLAVNPAFELLTGLNIREITGRTGREVLPNLEEHWIERYGRVAMTGEPVIFENYSRDLERWFAITAFSPQKGQVAVMFEHITDRRKTEEALRESEMMLRRAQTISRLGHFKYNPHTNAVDGSDELFRIFGLSHEEFHFPDFANTVHPDDRDFVVSTIGNSIEKGWGYDIEHRLLLNDGTVKFIRAIGEPVLNERGETVFMVGTVQDITDRKISEDALRGRDSIISAISNNLPSVMIYQIVRDRDGVRRFTYVSETVRLFYGCSPEEAMADPGLIYGRVAEEDRERIFQEEEEAYNSLSTFKTEVRMVAPGGDLRWSQFVSSPRKLGDGSTRWDGIEIDITELKHMEESLRDGEEALALSEDRFRQMVDAVTDYIYTVTVRDGKPVATSHGPACKNVTGYSPGDYEADPGLWYRMVHDDDRYLVETQAAGMLSGEGAGTIEHRIIHRDGSTRWVRNTPVLLRDGQGKIIGYDGLIVDITERKRAEEELVKSAHEKDVLMKELQHRVKNNLAVIDGLLSLEMQNLADAHSRQVFQDTIDRIHTISMIYEQLYNLSSFDSVDLKKYVGDIAIRLHKIYVPDLKRISLSLKLDEMKLDVRRTVPLGLIMNELITNVFKYAYPDGRSGELRVCLMQANGEISLEVSDDGPGLSGDVRARKTSGMGIRLVDMLAKQIDAGLILEGEKGTIARITFPV